MQGRPGLNRSPTGVGVGVGQLLGPGATHHQFTGGSPRDHTAEGLELAGIQSQRETVGGSQIHDARGLAGRIDQSPYSIVATEGQLGPRGQVDRGGIADDIHTVGLEFT